MPNFNKIILAGHLTKDPENRTTQTGMMVCNFGIAVTSRWKKNDQMQEEVLFIDCAAFGKLAETLSGRVKKGSPLLVEGKLRQEEWEKDGQKRRKYSVTVDGFQFLNGKRDEEEPEQAPKRSGGRSKAPADAEDIPF